MDFTIGPRETAWSHYGGVSYGSKLLNVLVLDDNSMFVHVPSQMTYINRMSGSRYYPASLMIVHDFDPATRPAGNIRAKHWKTFDLELSGLRFTQALLARDDIRAAVTKEWCEAIADALNVKSTITIRRKP